MAPGKAQLKELIFLVGILFFACRKEDNPILPDLARVPAVLVKMDAASDKFISPVAPAGFKGKLVIDLLFANEKPQSVDIVVMRNDDPTNVKVLKPGVTTFPTTIDVTGQQAVPALPLAQISRQLKEKALWLFLERGQTHTVQAL